MLFDRLRDWLIGLLQPSETKEPCFEVKGRMMKRSEIFSLIAAPLDQKQIRTAKVPMKKGGNFNKRYVTARDVMERLDSICPGLWEFRHEFAKIPNGDTGQFVVKGSLTICGITREDTGMNDSFEDYDPAKSATSDALKRCAVQFGFGRELYGESAPPKPKHWTENPVNWRKFEAWFSEQPNVSMEQVHELLGGDHSEWPDANSVKTQIEELARPF